MCVCAHVLKTCGVAYSTRCPRAGDVITSKHLQCGGAFTDPHMTSCSGASKPPLCVCLGACRVAPTSNQEAVQPVLPGRSVKAGPPLGSEKHSGLTKAYVCIRISYL